MDILESPRVEIRRSRPPTAVYPDRDQVARYRETEFPATAAPWERLLCLNLDGVFLSAASLQELIVPLAQAVRGGVYGEAALMVAISDDAMVDVLEALARRHELPLFIAPAGDSPLTAARPVGGLTTKEAETLELMLRMGGETTSSRFAELAGIEISAAGNRLTTLARKGYLYRRRRSKREGDVYVDPRNSERRATDSESGRPAGPVEVPDDLREAVRHYAELSGSEPGEVLQQAWREFTERHADAMAEASEEAARLIAAEDSEGLASLANRNVRDRAEIAAKRAQ